MFTSFTTYRTVVFRTMLAAAAVMVIGFACQSAFAADSEISLQHNKANAIQRIDAIDQANPPAHGQQVTVPSDISLQHSKLNSAEHMDYLDRTYGTHTGAQYNVPSDISLQHDKLESVEHMDLIDNALK